MRIRVERQADLRMPERLHDGPRVHALGEQERGGRVHPARRSPSICLSQIAIWFQLVKIWVPRSLVWNQRRDSWRRVKGLDLTRAGEKSGRDRTTPESA